MTLEEGEITQAAAPVVSQESIDQILAAALGLAALLGERAGDILAAANGVEGLDVAVRFQDAAAVYGLGALLLALAVLLAAATVLRCTPKDILSQME